MNGSPPHHTPGNYERRGVAAWMTSKAEESDEGVTAAIQQVRRGHVPFMRYSFQDPKITQCIFCVPRHEDASRVA